MVNKKPKSKLPLVCVIAVLALLNVSSAFAQNQNVNFSRDPKLAKLVVSDIDNFWRAYDLAQKEPAFDKRVEIYQREYYDKASSGLKSFIALRIGKASELAKKIDSMPKYYASIRPSTMRVAEMRSLIFKSFEALKKVYPEAVFPDVYFVIGRISSGGTAWTNGLLIGTEMSCLTDKADPAEFTYWHRYVLKPIEQLPGIVAHELIHFQQPPLTKSNLLKQSLIEGAADFLGEMISSQSINSKSYVYATANEKALWREFSAEMDSSKFDKWIYNSNITDRSPDLGYFIGYKICEAYYKKAKNKNQAIADILNIKDEKEFLRLSSYGTKVD